MVRVYETSLLASSIFFKALAALVGYLTNAAASDPQNNISPKCLYAVPSSSFCLIPHTHRAPLLYFASFHTHRVPLMYFVSFHTHIEHL